MAVGGKTAGSGYRLEGRHEEKDGIFLLVSCSNVGDLYYIVYNPDCYFVFLQPDKLDIRGMVFLRDRKFYYLFYGTILVFKYWKHLYLCIPYKRTQGSARFSDRAVSDFSHKDKNIFKICCVFP